LKGTADPETIDQIERRFDAVKQKKSCKDVISPDFSTPLPIAEAKPSSRSRPLTPSELESLKKDMRESSRKMEEMLRDYSA